MKLLFRMLLFISMFAVSGCNVFVQKSSQRTSGARAAYGNAAPGFNAHKKKNQKRKANARKEGKRKKVRNRGSYFQGRPY